MAASVFFMWSSVMHGCKPCPIEPFIYSSFSHKEFEDAAEEMREKTLAKEARGVFCAQKGSNPRNGELGQDST